MYNINNVNYNSNKMITVMMDMDIWV